MDPSEVTLTIPCFNVGDTLSRTLDAVDELRPGPARVVCVDDGSTDETAEIIAARDGVTLVSHDENRGLGATMNTAIERTTTPGLAKIDGDIVVPPNWLAQMCACLAEKDADFIQGKYTDEVTTVADKWRDKHPSPPFPDEPIYNLAINGAHVLARTDVLRDVDGYDQQFRRAYDDIDVAERLRFAGYRVYYTPEIEVVHTRTDTVWTVLRMAWDYHTDPLTGRLPPERGTDVLKRLPFFGLETVRCVMADVRDGDYELVPISLLLFFSHVKWDLERGLDGETRSERPS